MPSDGPFKGCCLMKLEISCSKASDRFLSKNRELMTEDELERLIIQSVRKILKIEDVALDIKSLKDKYRGYFRIRKGKIRIIFSLKKDKVLIALIHAVGLRKDIYR